jgi:soluble lytic murein transglycosylase-like protein
MKRVTVAVAIATGMMSFAVNAQEAPASADLTGKVPAKETKAAPVALGYANTFVPLDAAKSTSGKDAPKQATKSVKKEKSGRTVVTFEDRGMVAVEPGVDETKTASIPTRKRPELVATARNEEKVTGKAIVSGGSYSAIIARYASTYGVPISLAHAVIRVESNYRAGARGSAGEVGLMQIKPATARGMGYSGSVKGLYNPETNIKYGMKYLGMAHKLGGGATCATILKYNAGHGAKRMNPISAAYCSKVKRLGA